MSWQSRPTLTRRRVVPLMAMAVAGPRLFRASTAQAQQSNAPQIPKVTVKFAHEPYFDHTQAIIGLKQGWFEDVGITFEPNNTGIVVGGDEALAVFASGRVDVMSGSAQVLLPGADRLPPFKMFFFADIFQGYAILGQPDGNYKSFAEFVAEGKSADEAYRAAVGQMKGKTFAYPPEAAIKGFIDLSLSKGGLTLSDMKTNVADDAANVALMQAGRADFQVGGVPSRLTLQSAGFKPILTSADLAQYAKPTADSVELRAVFQDGWLATDDWLKANHDTALRLAGVGFRINAFINAKPDEAAAIQTPFLNSVAGTHFDNAVAKVAYQSLDPFLPFDAQKAWHLDPNSPLNGQYVIGSAIKLYEEQGLFKPGQYKWSDFSIADQIYKELIGYRDKASGIIQTLEAATPSGDAADLLTQAKRNFGILNYLDAARFAEAAQAAG